MRITAKLIALLLLVPLALAAYSYASLYFAGYLFPLVRPRPYIEMVSAAAVGSLAAGLVTAFPLARMFSHWHWLAALAVASPFVAIRISDLVHYADKNEPRIMVMSLVELLLYPCTLAAFAWFVNKRLGASRIANEKSQPRSENAA